MTPELKNVNFVTMNRDVKEHAQLTNGLGKAFIKMPRSILNMSFRPESKERQLGQIFILLLTNAFYIDGFVRLSGHKHSCRRGEYVGNYQMISDCTGINPNSIGRFLRILEREHLITRNTVYGGIRVGIRDYETFMGVEPETGNAKAVPSLAELEKRFKGGRSMQDLDEKQEGGKA